MNFSLTSRVTSAPRVLKRELDGEAVLLNLDNESYYGLDRVGTQMWILLTSGETIASTIEHLQREYDVASDRLEIDVRKLLSELHQEGLIQISDEALA